MDLEALKALAEKIKQDPTQVSAEELTEARDAIRALVADTKGQEPTEESIATLEALVVAKGAVDGETQSRAVAAAEQAQKAQALIDSLEAEPEPPAEPTAQDGADGGEDAPAAEVEPAAEPALAASAGVLVKAIAEGVKQAFAAQTPTAPKPAQVVEPKPQGRIGRPGFQAPARTTPREVAAVKVYTGRDDKARELGSTEDLVKAFHDVHRGAYQAPVSGKFTVASARTEFPESRQLGRDSYANLAKIEAVTSPQALVAAGGLCSPLETDYSIDVIGASSRPLRDALARFAVDRGGLTYRKNYSAADASSDAAGVWTSDDDEAATDAEESDPPSKGYYAVVCPDAVSAEVQAIYSQLEFSNVSTRFDPESTAANVRLGEIAHARQAENSLYDLVAAGSKAIAGTTQVIGSARHLLGDLDHTLAYYRDRHRIDTNVTLTWVARNWVKNEIRKDIAFQIAAGDWESALGVADSVIERWFTERGVQPVWWLDGSTSETTVNGITIPRQTYANLSAGGAVPAFPTKVDSLLFPAGSWLFLDGGSLDLGLVRDSTLNAKNRYRTFFETWEGAAFRGPESLRPVFTLKPTGATSSTQSITA